MSDLPEEWTDPRRPWGLLGLCAGSLVLNLVLGVRLLWAPAGDEVVPEVASAPMEITDPAAAPPVDGAPAAAPAVAAAPAAPTKTTQLAFAVDGPLSVSFAKAAPERGDAVALVYARLFAFDIDLRKLGRGDEVKVSYALDERNIPVIDYASYHGAKATLSAYKYQAAGDTYPSWWDDQGAERQPRLVDSPIADYEQITSLLRDGRGHHGMDFKVPEGAKIVSPRSGTVVRTDWNWGANGNCVEVKYDDGTLARFLHLSRTDVAAGKRIAKGDVIGLSGNTGHSTAPHLHYELEKGGKIVDPVDYHGTTTRHLPDAEMAAFQAAKQSLDARFATPSGA